MTLLHSIFMGAIQGLTEFLPISSSGHLALFQRFFGSGLFASDQMFFTVMLHFGTLIAVLSYYRHEILSLLKELVSFLKGIFDKRKASAAEPVPPERRLILLLIVATVPTVLLAPFKSKIEIVSGNILFVSVSLLITGFLLFFPERVRPGKKTEKTATVRDALLVGCAQAIAVVPGISRSGATISVGRFFGLDRDFATKFSFLMSIPAVLGATLLELKDAVSVGVQGISLPVILAGILTSFLVGYFSVHLVTVLSHKGKLGNFAYYCWAVGLVSLVLNFVLK